MLVFAPTVPTVSAQPTSIHEPLDDFLFSDGAIQTDEFILAVGGRTIDEGYAHGYTAAMPHPAWSVSKAVLGVLTGIAVREHQVALKDSVCRFLTEYQGKADICALQIVHLLGHESGLKWRETIEGGIPARSSVLQMLFGDGYLDMPAYVLSLGFAATPGTLWNYSSGDSLVLSAVLARIYGDADFAWKKLFDPLGMTNVTWERDSHGVLVGSSYLTATARDLARFGMLLAQNGVWGKERILPENWLDASARFPTAFAADDRWIASDRRPGFHLWLNKPHPLDPAHRKVCPAAPDDMIAAHGLWGQSIVVIPSMGLVAVRLGNDRGKELDFPRYVELLIERARKRTSP